MQNSGEIIASDIDPARLERVAENCARLGVTCVRTVPADELDPLLEAGFDRILIDAPCSNTVCRPASPTISGTAPRLLGLLRTNQHCAFPGRHAPPDGPALADHARGGPCAARDAVWTADARGGHAAPGRSAGVQHVQVFPRACVRPSSASPASSDRYH